MTTNRSAQCLEGNLYENGLTIPTPFAVMKKNFKRELIKFYLGSLGKGQKVLDLNPGFEGIYNELNQPGAEYMSLEQNPHVRSFLNSRNVLTKDWKIPVIPLEDNSVDYVLSAPFIEHLPTYIDALNLLLEIKRILKPGGKILLLAPNYLNLKTMFFEDYRHGWVVTKRRLIDMLSDCDYEVLGHRYTIGLITMRMNPLTGLSRLTIHLVMSILGLNLVDRLLETLRLDTLGNKFKKTFFEAVVIEAQVKKIPGITLRQNDIHEKGENTT